MKPNYIDCQFLVSVAERCIAAAKETSELKTKAELTEIAEILLGKVREVADSSVVALPLYARPL